MCCSVITYKNGHYYSLNQYLQEKFGCKVYKLALDGGCTCPNRDGTIGSRGCIFCSEGGSGEFAQKKCKNIAQQIELAKLRVSDKIKSGKYIAYFQSYTNTYAPVSYLKEMFSEAIKNDSIVALSVGTRPDCLSDDVLELLAELNSCKPVWVELGLQTIHKDTADYIRRGYDLPVFGESVKRLKNLGITVIVHVILGLPYESREKMLQTVDYVGRSGADGIKLQLLHVLKDTDLENEYKSGKFEVLSMNEYIDILSECIEILPPDMVIHRLTGDGDKKLLVAPMWSTDKKVVLNAINRTFAENDIVQGKLYTNVKNISKNSI